MNEKIDMKAFLSLKTHNDCMNLDINIINSILESFTSCDTKIKKYSNQPKKTINILKNPKLKMMKDKISNKVNLIFNKLSENNIENLVIEFIETVKIQSIDDYNEFLRAFYNKILSEINFSKNYLNFFILITSVYNHVFKYTLEYFYNLIEYKFKYDYENTINDEYEFLKELNDDTKRINNLTLIDTLIKLNYFNSSFKTYIENYLLNQTIYLSDIYHWFKTNQINSEQLTHVKLLVNDNILLRDKILLENLISGNVNIEESSKKIIFKKQNTNVVSNVTNTNVVTNLPLNTNIVSNVTNVTNTNVVSNVTNTNVSNVPNTTELDNILDEYLFINSAESFEDYILNNCKDANEKNMFCEYTIDKYFKLVNNDSTKILSLLKLFIKKKILFKSNLSRGLLNINLIKHNYSKGKIKDLLLFLKQMGITKGLEQLMSKHNIDINI